MVKNNDGDYWDDKKTILRYKLEPVSKHVIHPKMEKIIRTDKYEHTQDVENNDSEPLTKKLMIQILHG
jgi:hypothetical protein